MKAIMVNNRKALMGKLGEFIDEGIYKAADCDELRQLEKDSPGETFVLFENEHLISVPDDVAAQMYLVYKTGGVVVMDLEGDEEVVKELLSMAEQVSTPEGGKYDM